MQSINHTRIRNTIKEMTDLNVSSELIPLVENNMIEELNYLLNNSKVKELMKVSHRKTLFREDLGLNNRFLELGKLRKFANSELRTLILKNIGVEKHIQNGVIDMIRGYLVEKLRVKILKIEKIVKHSPNNKTMKARHWKLFYL